MLNKVANTETDNSKSTVKTTSNKKESVPQMVLLNIQGMHPGCKNQRWKISALSEDLQKDETFIPFIGITESHLDSSIFDAEIQIPGYNILRSDRINRKQGGVILYTYKNIIHNDSVNYSDKYCEAVAVYIKHYNIMIAIIYRPPNAPEKSFTDCMGKIQEFTSKYDEADKFILGDFNFKFVQWESEKILSDGIPASESRQARTLIDYMNKNLLVQTVHENTRAEKSILDIVLVNNEELIHSIQVEKNQYSDHDMVKCKLLHENICMAHEATKSECRETKSLDNLYMHKADWNKIREEIRNINWDIELNKEKDIEKVYDIFEEVVTNVCSKYTPIRERQKARDKMPRDRLALIRNKKNLNAKINMYKYVKVNTMNEDKRIRVIEKLENRKLEIETKIKHSIIQESERREEEAIGYIKRNPKAFFTYTKRFMKVTTNVGPLKDDKGYMQSDAKKKAQILQEQFKKVFSDPGNSNIDDIKINENVSSKVEDIEFTVKEVEDAIDSIPTYAAPGPDKFPAVILKECKKELSYPLYTIWRKSLDDGKIPGKLKIQSIIPIFKKGSKAEAANYRPVSLTSHIIKLFERVLRKKIVKFMEENNLISKYQFGFRSGRSTIIQLLEHLDNIISILEENENADVVYLDFAKAFDKVDHKILLHKLSLLGIQGKLLSWIEDFIANRIQHVIVEGEKSNKATVISGVPQGTVLGPILFIIYINDLTEAIKYSQMLVFADDTKFTKKIKNKQDHADLEKDLHASIIWSLTNNMQLNNDKFQLLQHGKSKDLKTEYTINNNIKLNNSKEVKDLGIYISEDMSWDVHITNIINTSKKYTFWILRTFRSRKKEIILFLFKTFVIPRLEYGCQIWSPHLKKDIIRLESLQKMITSKIDGVDGQNYHERLKTLKLYSLQRRRERFIMITMWKIEKGFLPNQINIEFYETMRFGVKARRKVSKSTNLHMKTVRFHHFTSLGPALYNLIPKNIKGKNTLETFKKSLDIYLQNIPDCPPSPGYVCLNNNSLLDWAMGYNTQRMYTYRVDDNDGEAEPTDLANR